MEIMSNIYDYRIKSTNLYIETTFGEYLQYAKDLIKNNDLQRKRVKTSQTVYSLLKEDLLNGCVIPPLVLAVMSDDDRLKSMESDELQDYIKSNKEKVILKFSIFYVKSQRIVLWIKIGLMNMRLRVRLLQKK